MTRSKEYKFFWSIKTTSGEDMVLLLVGIWLLFNVHWSFGLIIPLLHFLFVYPREPGNWTEQ